MKTFQATITATLLSASAIASVVLTTSLFTLLLTSKVGQEEKSLLGSGRSFQTYSYEGDDFPISMPIQSDPQVKMVVEESVHYSISDPEATDEWVYTSPFGTGSYRLGPDNRAVFVTMFHQLHCLRMIRTQLMNGGPHEHSRHCLNYLRELVLCAADTTLEPGDFTKRNFTEDREGETHVCRDWTAIYAEINANWFQQLRVLKELNFTG